MKTIKLEGAFKKAFEKWYIEEYLYYGLFGIKVQKSAIKSFYEQKISEQYGIFEDFGDSVGKRISIFPLIIRGVIIYEIFINESHKGDYGTRYEARTAAILKLMEIYNERNNNTKIQ